MTVTNWYKQNVYDAADNKIGEVKDVLVSQDGKVTALIVSVGGFPGIGEKDVAVPFSSVTQKMKDGKSYLTLDTTKDALKSAPGFAYDSKTMTWAPPPSGILYGRTAMVLPYMASRFTSHAVGTRHLVVEKKLQHLSRSVRPRRVGIRSRPTAPRPGVAAAVDFPFFKDNLS
jgi:sporulation protein YlmC with PRC-barrel domain